MPSVCREEHTKQNEDQIQNLGGENVLGVEGCGQEAKRMWT